jgi:hypothetical protein
MTRQTVTRMREDGETDGPRGKDDHHDQTDGHEDEEGCMTRQTYTRMRGDCETDGPRGRDDH